MGSPTFTAFTTGQVLTAAVLNAFPNSVVAAFLTIDRTNMGINGIDASSIIPTTAGAATFGGGTITYTFNGSLAVGITAGGSIALGPAGSTPQFVMGNNAASGTKTTIVSNTPSGTANINGITPSLWWMFQSGTALGTGVALDTSYNWSTTGGIIGKTGIQTAPTINATSTLAYVPPTYAAGGTALGATAHIVQGQVTAAGGTTTVTLTGAAQFTSGTTYTVYVFDITDQLGANVTAMAAGSFAFASVNTKVYMYLAVGT